MTNPPTPFMTSPMIYKRTREYFHDREKKISPEALELIDIKIIQFLDRIIRETESEVVIKAKHVYKFKIVTDL